MANDKAIAAVSEALRSLLAQAASGPEFSGARFEIYQATNLQAPMPEGVSVYLYRVSIDPRRTRIPPGIPPAGPRRPPSLPLDLHYLITAWSLDPLRQQFILAWAARVIEDAPVLPASLLNRRIPGVFGEGESVQLTVETLSLDEEAKIWNVAKSNRQPSLAYIARSVEIESHSKPGEPDVK
jgi:hypothetical protein